MNKQIIIAIAGFLVLGPSATSAQTEQDSRSAGAVMIDDFEGDTPGAYPSRWRHFKDEKLVPLDAGYMRENERFYVVREGSRTFVRAYSKGEAAHITMGNDGAELDWDTRTHTVMEWDWRANHLPPNAREDHDKLNDSGGGIYIAFEKGNLIFRQPRALKYVYSSTLPVNTVIKHGKLAVIVVSSAINGSGSWTHVRRNVVEDYRAAFGSDPVRRPWFIRLWSDSDTVGPMSEVDFDNLRLTN